MIALIDGDPLIYQAYWHVKRTYETYLKKLKKRFTDGEIDEEHYNGQLVLAEKSFAKNGFAKAKINMDMLLENILNELFVDEYAIAVGGVGNYRLDIHPEYKASKTRAAVRSSKPVWFDDLKDYLAAKEESISTDGYEADDLLRIWSNDCKRTDTDYIICSIDKDLDCIDGKHYINIHPTKPKHQYEITAEYADWFYWYQVLMGDNVDNIPGLKGCGPKTAAKILEDVEPCDYQKAVCIAYHNKYDDPKGDQYGYENMLFNGRLIHIWRSFDDHFKITRETYDEAIK
jgi:5'-3' exonuclease